MTIDKAIRTWIAQEFNLDASLISNIKFDQTAGGTCGEGTCWFDGECEIEFSYDGKMETRTVFGDDAMARIINECLTLSAQGDV